MKELDVTKEVTAMERMTVGQLQRRYAEVFGEPVRSRHKQYLIRRIAWRLQANAEGGLSERALRRAEELANAADVRVTPPRAAKERLSGTATSPVPAKSPTLATPPGSTMPPVGVSDRRLPPVGAAVTRRYKGQTISVTVLPDGFEYEGDRYKSLTAVAKAITGSHMNGFRFFGLGDKK